MTKTQLAPAPWPEPKEEKPKVVRKYDQKARKKIDINFEEWAQREGIDWKSMKLMEKKR